MSDIIEPKRQKCNHAPTKCQFIFDPARAILPDGSVYLGFKFDDVVSGDFIETVLESTEDKKHLRSLFKCFGTELTAIPSRRRLDMLELLVTKHRVLLFDSPLVIELCMEEFPEQSRGTIRKIARMMVSSMIPYRNCRSQGMWETEPQRISGNAATDYSPFIEYLTSNYSEIALETAMLYLPVLSEIKEFLMAQLKTNSIIHGKIIPNATLNISFREIPQKIQLFDGVLKPFNIFLSYLKDLNSDLIKKWIRENSEFINILLLSALFSDEARAVGSVAHAFRLHAHHVPIWEFVSRAMVEKQSVFLPLDNSKHETEDIILKNLTKDNLLFESIKGFKSLLPFWNHKTIGDINVTFQDELGSGQGLIYSWMRRVLDKLLDPQVKIFYRETASGVYNICELSAEYCCEYFECLPEALLKFLYLFFVLLFRYKFSTGVQFSSYFMNVLFSQVHMGDFFALEFAKELDEEFTNSVLKLRNEPWELVKEYVPEDLKDISDVAGAIRYLLKQRFNFTHDLFPDYETTQLHKIHLYPKYLSKLLMGKPIDQNWSCVDCYDCTTKNYFQTWISQTTRQDEFLRAVTGRIPQLKFLEPKLTIITEESYSEHRLPTIATCFHSITFPLYSNYEVFKNKLEKTLDECKVEYFGIT